MNFKYFWPTPVNHQFQPQGIRICGTTQHWIYFYNKICSTRPLQESLNISDKYKLYIWQPETSAHRWVCGNLLYQSSVKQIQGVQGVKGLPSYTPGFLYYHQQLHFTSLTETKTEKKILHLFLIYFYHDDSSDDLY